MAVYRLQPNPYAIKEEKYGVKGHRATFKFPGTKIVLDIPNNSHGRYVDLFEGVSDKDKKALEEYFKLELNPVKSESFYQNYIISFIIPDKPYKEIGFEFDTDNPEQYLQYLVLRVQDDVAADLEEAKKRGSLSKWVLVDTDQEQNRNAAKFDEKVKLFSMVNAIIGKRRSMKELLRAYGYPFTENAKIEALKGILNKLLADEGSSEKLFALLNSKTYADKVLMSYAVQIGEVVLRNTVYTLSDGKLLGDSLDEAIITINSELYKPVKEHIQNKINEYIQGR